MNPWNSNTSTGLRSNFFFFFFFLGGGGGGGGELLKKANRPPMYVSRMKTIGVEMYKCRHQLNPTFVSNMFSVPERMYNLKWGSQFVQPNVNTTTFGLNT